MRENEKSALPPATRHTIRVYVDSFRAQLVARRIAETSRSSAEQILASATSWQRRFLGERLDLSFSPERLASFLAEGLRWAERKIVAQTENDLSGRGIRVVRQGAVQALSNPYMKGGLFEEPNLDGDTYVSVKSDGIIFAPKMIDAPIEKKRLRSHKARASERGLQPAESDWLDRNLNLIDQGKIARRKGDEVDLAFSQKFVDCIGELLGSVSRSGRYDIHWDRSSILGEKGVDADLTIGVMDDLHAETVDTFVFLTNDSDFSPLIERVRKDSHPVYLCGHSERVSNQLLSAIGGKPRFFDLADPGEHDTLSLLWLKTTDQETLEVWEDIERQRRHNRSRRH